MDLLSNFKRGDWTAKIRAGPRRCGTRSSGNGAGLGLLAPRVTPPGLEGVSPLIASSYYRTSCSGGELGLPWVALAPGLRRETKFTRSWAPEAKWG